jgi:hypothetical protein
MLNVFRVIFSFNHCCVLLFVQIGTAAPFLFVFLFVGLFLTDNNFDFAVRRLLHFDVVKGFVFALDRVQAFNRSRRVRCR